MIINLDPYAERVIDTVADYSDPLVQRTLVKTILADVVVETAEKLNALVPSPTKPPKGRVLGTFTRERGIQP